MIFVKNARFRTILYVLCLWLSVGPHTPAQALFQKSTYVFSRLIKPMALSYVVAAPVIIAVCVAINIVHNQPLAPRWDQINDGCIIGLVVSPLAMLSGLTYNGTIKRMCEDAEKQYPVPNTQQTRKSS